jgi:hypothetical protein
VLGLATKNPKANNVVAAQIQIPLSRADLFLLLTITVVIAAREMAKANEML